MPSQAQERVLTELDHVRLSKILERQPHMAGNASVRESLAAMLDLADLVPSPEIPADVVTVSSMVTLQDPNSETTRQVRLSYPDDMPPGVTNLSVLSPAGWALLGLRVGDTAEWETPTGEVRSTRIVGIAYQPEANGDFTA